MLSVLGRRDRMVDVLVKSVPFTDKVVSSNPVDGEVYSIQHYVIKFAVTRGRSVVFY